MKVLQSEGVDLRVGGRRHSEVAKTVVAQQKGKFAEGQRGGQEGRLTPKHICAMCIEMGW